MEDSVTFSTDSEDSILAPSKLDSKDLSFASPTTIVSKLNALNNLKYNVGGGHDKLAELFRKDLISAMKLPDHESLQPEDYHLISDPWRQDWERGVQVPINPDDAKEGNVVIIKENEMLHGSYAFKLPKKFLHATQDETYKQGMHELHGMQSLADEVCRYDLDDFDSVWLKLYNELRNNCGEEPLDEWVMERVMEQLETQCYDGMQEAMKTVEGLGIEYDEDIVCDVCRSPEVEEGNEMVFCDGCDVCVHQACYGIVKIPKGNWMCKTCVLNVKPNCVLCPNVSGAMKPTEDGLRWAHLSCAIWIPEVTIGCSETMQPIKDIDEIPATRWALICTLCRERTGACIQCCVKKCKTAFHVTCAFENNLEMKVNLEDDNSDVQLKGYCPAHSKKHDSDGSPRKTPTSTPKKTNEMTEEEKTAERSRRLQKLAEEFYTYVDLKKVANAVKTDKRTVDFVYCYWLLKRKCNFNKALLTPKVEEGDLLLKQREDTMVARLKMFIHLRQDLERVRNLCYMVTKREKLRTQLHRVKMQLFLQQSKILRKEKLRSNGREYKSICTAHKQTMSIYDQPEKVMKTSKYFENVNEMDSDVNTPRKVQRLTPVVRTSGTSLKLTPQKPKPKPKTPTENPYAKPTYKSFSWMLSARRRSQGSTSASPEKQVEESLDLAGWQPKKRRGRRPKSAIGLERTYDENTWKADNENASVCDVSGDISSSCIQKIVSRKPDLSNDKHVPTKQENCSFETGDSDPGVSTKQITCSLETNYNSHPDGTNAPEVAKINTCEEPSRGEIVEQTIVPQKRRRGRPPKVRVTQSDNSNTSVCQEKQKEDPQRFRKKVNGSDISSPDTFAFIKQESDGKDQVCHEKELGVCTLEEGIKLEVLEDPVQSKTGFFDAASKDEQGRDLNVEPNSTDSVEHATELLQNNLKSGSDKQDAEGLGVCNDFKPDSSSALHLLGSREPELCRSTASPTRSRNFGSLDPSHLGGRSSSPSNELLIKPTQTDKCCNEKQNETLLNSSSVEENEKVGCILQISKELEHSRVSNELTNTLLDCKKCVPLKNVRLNGKRRPMSLVTKRKSSRLFGGKQESSDVDVDEKQSRTALHLKENGLLKNQPTLDRFIQKSKQEPEKAEIVKRNGSLYETQEVNDEVGVTNRTEETIDAMDYTTEGLSQRHSSPISDASDNDATTPSQRLCSRSASLPLNLPNRKRRVHSDSNIRSKKRLRYAKGGKESVPPGGMGSDIDDEGPSKKTKLKDVDSKLTNGFSPVNRRYRTRQSLGSS